MCVPFHFGPGIRPQLKFCCFNRRSVQLMRGSFSLIPKLHSPYPHRHHSWHQFHWQQYRHRSLHDGVVNPKLSRRAPSSNLQVLLSKSSIPFFQNLDSLCERNVRSHGKYGILGTHLSNLAYHISYKKIFQKVKYCLKVYSILIMLS